MSSLVRRLQIRAMKAMGLKASLAKNAAYWPRFLPKGEEPKPAPKSKPKRKLRLKARRDETGKWVRRQPRKFDRRTFAVPAQPVRSTRAQRQDMHVRKMTRKSRKAWA